MLAGDEEPSASRIDTTTTQDVVRRGGTRPWLFAFVGVASLCLTQMFYYYFRGANSIYVDYERGCGEWCFEGEPTLLQSGSCTDKTLNTHTLSGRWAVWASSVTQRYDGPSAAAAGCLAR